MSATDIPQFNVFTPEWQKMAGGDGIEGHEAILYRSEDGRRMAGTFKESGRSTLVMPFDEFVYVLAGTATVTVTGREPLVASVGDAFYVREGQEVTWELSEDFQDVTVLISDNPIS